MGRIKAKTNPNKVNQHTAPDPRQSLFLAYYIDPKSATFSNAYQSALKAGYEEEYASTILNQDLAWLSESLSDASLLNKAEKRLNQILDFEPVDDEGKIDNSLIANQMKAVTLVAKGIGKNKYSERVEQTGANGKDLPTPIINVLRDNGSKQD
jgi:hypothetical protein